MGFRLWSYLLSNFTPSQNRCMEDLIALIFFIFIPGYLISGILLSGVEKDDFSFAEFYARCVKRILVHFSWASVL